MTAPENDPFQAAASDRLNRRFFVGISAAATLCGPALALGDPAISEEHVTLTRPDVELPAYAALPVGAASDTPGAVVIMHVWGVDESIREAVRRLAEAGFAAIAPDLYGRFGAPSGDGVSDSSVFRPYAKRLDRAQYDGDIRAAAAWLTQRFAKNKIGILGFCMGGRIAMLAAIDDRDAFSAVCPFYGAFTDVDPHAIRVPLCGSYGARDTSIPAESVNAFAASLDVPNDIRIYDDAGHAFCDDKRPSYVASAAEDAWKRTISFLKKYLGGAQA
jgi:carboxymethylenebutenolidase